MEFFWFSIFYFLLAVSTPDILKASLTSSLIRALLASVDREALPAGYVFRNEMAVGDRASTHDASPGNFRISLDCKVRYYRRSVFLDYLPAIKWYGSDVVEIFFAVHNTRRTSRFVRSSEYEVGVGFFIWRLFDFFLRPRKCAVHVDYTKPGLTHSFS